MSCLGKVIGGTIGIALTGGNPIGAFIGAVIGHLFDRQDTNRSQNNSQNFWYSQWNEFEPFNFASQQQMVFFAATFSMLGKMASAGDKISEAELRTIEDFIDNNLGLGYQEKQFALRIVVNAAQSPETFEKFAQQFYMQFHNHQQMLYMMYDILSKVAAADGTINPEEKRILDQAAAIFRLQYRRTTAASGFYSTSDKNYEILGVKRTDSVEVIKKSYKKLIKDYHPDIVSAKGLPEEFINIATEKFKEINQAYEEIRKERGF